MDNGEKFIGFVAVSVLFGFMAFLVPDLLNNVYAYGNALVIGLAITVVLILIYLLTEVIGKHG